MREKVAMLEREKRLFAAILLLAAAWTAPAITTTPASVLPIYDTQTGWPLQKVINGSVVEKYGYLANGQLQTVVDNAGVGRAYSYDNGGALVRVDWTNAPSTFFQDLDLTGRPLTVAHNGTTNRYTYLLDGSVATVDNSGVSIPASSMSYGYDAGDGARVSAALTVGGVTVSQPQISYDPWRRVSGITNGALGVEYGYATNNSLVSLRRIKIGGSTVLEAQTQWDLTNSRISQLQWTWAGGTNLYKYQYVTGRDQISKITLADNSWWEYQYDTQRQLKRAQRFKQDGTEYLGRWFVYGSDAMGNLTTAGWDKGGGVAAWKFTANEFNLHVSRVWSNQVELVGTAVAGTNVLVVVNDQPCDRDGEKFRCRPAVSNSAGPVEMPIQVFAISNNVVASVSGTLYVAAASETITNLASGATAGDSRFAYEWEGFDRLKTATATNLSTWIKIENTYQADDPAAADGRPEAGWRRVVKKVLQSSNSGASWTTNETRCFVYDGWNLACETVTTPTLTYTNTYLWGLDLSGQRNGKYGQDAGGIGGLLAITVTSNGTSTTYLPVADHNGNIHTVLDAGTGEVVAEYEYSPYGVLIAESGPKAQLFNLRFQSKYYDRETELYYFTARYLDPRSGKWLCRDPKGESSDSNLTKVCGGDPVSGYDPLGLHEFSYKYGAGAEDFMASANAYAVLPLVRQVFDFAVPLSARTTGIPVWTPEETLGVQFLSGHNVETPIDVALARVTLERIGQLRNEVKGLGGDPRPLIYQLDLIEADVLSALQEYSEYGGLKSVGEFECELSSLSESQLSVRNLARAGEYGRIYGGPRGLETDWNMVFLVGGVSSSLLKGGVEVVAARGEILVPEGTQGIRDMMAKMSRDAGNEVGLFRLNTGQRVIRTGGPDSIFVGPDVRRLIAHTHPGGPMRFSEADLRVLEALRGRSSVLIDPASGVGRRVTLSEGWLEFSENVIIR